MIITFPSKTKTLEGNVSLKINYLVHFKVLCSGEHTRKLSQKEITKPGSQLSISEISVDVHYGKLSQFYTRENKIKYRIKTVRSVVHEKIRNKSN